MRARFATFFALILAFSLAAAARAERRTENVFIVTWDGFRHQELFTGANEFLVGSKGAGGQPEPLLLKARYWRETPEERRETLLPFMWGVVAKQGQIFGDISKNAPTQVTNGMKFSYPGYNELFCGFGDPTIDSNDKKENPNLSVLEFLNKRPGFEGKVAAICTWGVFPAIFRTQTSGVPVYASWREVDEQTFGPAAASINKLVRSLPHYWLDNTFDLLSMEAARAYIPRHNPRALYIGLGETDEWGHARRYDLYLDSARQSDAFVAELWEMIQSTPSYKDKTTLIITSDHGRGETPADWTSHGKDTKGAEFMWIAIIGPDTPALGVRENVSTMQSQVAATIAAFVGENFRAASPKAAAPLPGVGVGETE